MEEKTALTKSVNRALRLLRFTIHIGLKITLFDLHHNTKPNEQILLNTGKLIYRTGQIYPS